MVGTAWLVVMDNLLQRGGPMGALLGFTVGALMLLPIGYVYGELVKAIPDDAGEAAYVARLFSPKVSFVIGWMMLLSYFLTCPNSSPLQPRPADLHLAGLAVTPWLLGGFKSVAKCVKKQAPISSHAVIS
jgi:amino acid transporter